MRPRFFSSETRGYSAETITDYNLLRFDRTTSVEKQESFCYLRSWEKFLNLSKSPKIPFPPLLRNNEYAFRPEVKPFLDTCPELEYKSLNPCNNTSIREVQVDKGVCEFERYAKDANVNRLSLIISLTLRYGISVSPTYLLTYILGISAVV